jgi:hypothetical protein
MFKRLSNVSVDHSPSFGHDRLPGIDIGNDTLPWENDINPFGINGMETMSSTMAPNFAFDPALYQEPMAFETFEPISASTTADTLGYRFPSHHRHSSSMETSTPQSQSAFSPVNLQLPFDSTTGEPSLDRQTSSNAQIVGLSGESDPYLLSKYRYDVYNEAAFQSIRVRKMSGGPTDEEHDIPTFFQFQHNALVSRAQPREKTDTNERWRRELEELVNEETGKRLINLFYRYVQPYFPILSRENGDGDGREAREMPPCVLAAIYGHALPFCAWDEKLCVEVYTPPSADVLFKIAWMSCQPLLHTPTMAVLQTLLLLVQRRPTIRHVSDTPFKWVIMTTAVSIAQALGIDRDPTDWPIPSWEIQQRKRLAWAVYVQDKWLALNFGRSSHIQADDFDVPPLTENDFPEADRRYDDDASSAHFPIHHFLQLCRLTTIVDDILHNLFSIRATRRLHTSLEATLEVAKPLRIRLTEWYQSLPPGLLPNHPSSTGTPATAARRIPSPATSESPGRPLTAKTTTMATTTITTTIFTPRSSESASATAPLDLDGHGSLQLAYITAKIELFRAMLRPEVTDANAAAVTALRTGALAVAKEMCEFLEGLNARELEAFWASCEYLVSAFSFFPPHQYLSTEALRLTDFRWTQIPAPILPSGARSCCSCS